MSNFDDRSQRRIADVVRTVESGEQVKPLLRRRGRRTYGVGGFWAKITASEAISGTDNRWRYGFAEVTLQLNTFGVRPGGITRQFGDSELPSFGYALNVIEDINTAALAAPGVDLSNPDYTGFAPQPIEDGTVVWMMAVKDGDGELRHVFQCENAHDGGCPTTISAAMTATKDGDQNTAETAADVAPWTNVLTTPLVTLNATTGVAEVNVAGTYRALMSATLTKPSGTTNTTATLTLYYDRTAVTGGKSKTQVNAANDTISIVSTGLIVAEAGKEIQWKVQHSTSGDTLTVEAISTTMSIELIQ